MGPASLFGNQWLNEFASTLNCVDYNFAAEWTPSIASYSISVFLLIFLLMTHKSINSSFILSNKSQMYCTAFIDPPHIKAQGDSTNSEKISSH